MKTRNPSVRIYINVLGSNSVIRTRRVQIAPIAFFAFLILLKSAKTQSAVFHENQNPFRTHLNQWIGFKLRWYAPAGYKSTLAHLFVFFMLPTAHTYISSNVVTIENEYLKTDYDETYATRKHFTRSIFLTSHNHTKTAIPNNKSAKCRTQMKKHEKNKKTIKNNKKYQTNTKTE